MSDLSQRVTLLQSRLVPAFVERTVNELLRQRSDGGRGVDALALVARLLGDERLGADDLARAYARLKPPLVSAVECIPTLRFLDGG